MFRNLAVLCPFERSFSCRTLRLDNNKLSGLPEGLLTLTSLTHLSLRHNNFSNLPYRFGDLHRLEKLDLGENMLKTLPPTMVHLHNEWDVFTYLRTERYSCVDSSLHFRQLSAWARSELSDVNILKLTATLYRGLTLRNYEPFLQLPKRFLIGFRGWRLSTAVGVL